MYGKNAQKKLLVLEVLVIDAAKAVINFNDVKRTLYYVYKKRKKPYKLHIRKLKRKPSRLALCQNYFFLWKIFFMKDCIIDLMRSPSILTSSQLVEITERLWDSNPTRPAMFGCLSQPKKNWCVSKYLHIMMKHVGSKYKQLVYKQWKCAVLKKYHVLLMYPKVTNGNPTNYDKHRENNNKNVICNRSHSHHTIYFIHILHFAIFKSDTYWDSQNVWFTFRALI